MIDRLAGQITLTTLSQTIPYDTPWTSFYLWLFYRTNFEPFDNRTNPHDLNTELVPYSIPTVYAIWYATTAVQPIKNSVIPQTAMFAIAVEKVLRYCPQYLLVNELPLWLPCWHVAEEAEIQKETFYSCR